MKRPTTTRHYQITYAKFNLKMYYLPPSEREIWHFQPVDVAHTRKAVDLFSWEKAFRNLNVNITIFLLKVVLSPS